MKPKTKMSTVAVPYLTKAKVSHVSLVTRGANQIGLDEIVIAYKNGTQKKLKDLSELNTLSMNIKEDEGNTFMKTWKVTAESQAELEIAKTMFEGEYEEKQETAEDGSVTFALVAKGNVTPLAEDVKSELALSGTLKAYLAEDIVVEVAKQEDVEESVVEVIELPELSEVKKSLDAVSIDISSIQKGLEESMARIEKKQEEIMSLVSNVFEQQEATAQKLESVEKNFTEKIEHLEEDKTSLEAQVEEGVSKLARVVEENEELKRSPTPKEPMQEHKGGGVPPWKKLLPSNRHF